MNFFECIFMQIFLVGKDFGARVVFHFALLHPNRVSAVATLGVPFLLTSPGTFPQYLLPKGFYMLRWQVRACLI